MNRILIADVFIISGRGRVIVYTDLPINNEEIKVLDKIKISHLDGKLVGIMAVDGFEMITYRSPANGKPHKGSILVSWISGQVSDSNLKGKFFEKYF